MTASKKKILQRLLTILIPILLVLQRKCFTKTTHLIYPVQTEKPRMKNNSLSELHPSTSKEIQAVFRTTKMILSTGVDGITTEVLKCCEEELRVPLLDITKMSLAQSILPSALKIYLLRKQSTEQ